MGRPRKGVVQRPDGHWTVSLPLAVGSKQTRQFTDPDEAAVRRWYADGERALAAGQPLPDPDSYRTNRPAPALTALTLGDRTPAHWWAGPTAAFGHRFDKVTEAFLVHHYDRQRAGQPERRGAVVTVIDNDLKPFFAQHQVPVIEGITHELAGKLAAHLAALDAADEPQPEPWRAGHHPRREIHLRGHRLPLRQGAPRATARDIELLRHLAGGLSTARIAAAMSITVNTVRTRIRRLQHKLSVVGRDQVVECARQLGII